MENSIPKEKILRAVAGLKGISHEIRLSTLCYLSQQPMSVNALAEAIGVSQSSISQHLSKMQHAGWIDFDRVGTSKHYRIADPELIKLLDVLHELYCQ